MLEGEINGGGGEPNAATPRFMPHEQAVAWGSSNQGSDGPKGHWGKILQEARAALAGTDLKGCKVRPSMFDQDVISLAHGEGIRRPHPKVLADAQAALVSPQLFKIENYHFLEQYYPLYELIADDFSKLGVPKEMCGNIVVDAGTTRLQISVLRTLTSPDTVVITPPGFYHPLASWCDLVGRQFEVIPLGDPKSCRLQPADLERWLRNRSERTRPFFLVLFNPGMTGAVARPAEMAGIAEILRRNNGAALEDAMFAGLEFDKTLAGVRLASFAPERVITTCGASKRFCLANLRVGWACGPEAAMARLRYEVGTNAATLCRLTEIMAASALSVSDDYYHANVRECAQRAYLVEQLASEVSTSLGWNGKGSAPIKIVHEPEAGHSILLDFGEAVSRKLVPPGIDNSIALTEYFLARAKVAFSPGASMGWDGLYLRCNFASVGTHLTYPASRIGEHEFAHCGSVLDESLFEECFQLGRDLIRRAFLERIAQALEPREVIA